MPQYNVGLPVGRVSLTGFVLSIPFSVTIKKRIYSIIYVINESGIMTLYTTLSCHVIQKWNFSQSVLIRIDVKMLRLSGDLNLVAFHREGFTSKYIS